MKQVKLVLLQHVSKLGKVGDVVSVKPGYARNYLLPQRMALRANKANLEYFEQKKAEIEAANHKAKSDAEALSTKLNGLSIIVIRQASEKGALYGSVTTRDIAREVSSKGCEVKPINVSIEQAIKEVGVHNVKIVLHPEVIVEIRVSVAQTEEEAVGQLQTVDSAN